MVIMKKVLSLLLALVCIFTLTAAAFTAYAEDAGSPSATVTAGEGEETPDEPEPPAPPKFDVTMYICATANSLTGHVWLYFINNSDVPVTVGYLVLQPGQETSVGSLRNTRKNGGGTYYNGEAMMAAKDGKLDSLRGKTTSLKMTLNESQLNTVSEKIKSINYYEMIFFNCGMFATKVWNSVADKKVVHIVLPVFTILNMKTAGGKSGELLMKNPVETGVGAYKQKSGGIEPADEKSFNISCVNF